MLQSFHFWKISSPISRKGVCAKISVLSYRYHPIPYAMVYLVSNRHDDTAKAELFNKTIMPHSPFSLNEFSRKALYYSSLRLYVTITSNIIYRNSSSRKE